VESVGPRDRPKKLGVRLWKMIVRPSDYARKILWTTGNGDSKTVN